MRVRRFVIEDHPMEGILGSVMAHNVPKPSGRGFVFQKGHRLTEQDLPRLADLRGRAIHVIHLEAGDLHEAEAGLRLAKAVAGEGVRIKGYIGAQYHLVAEKRGLLRVDTSVLDAMNLVEGVSIFTKYDLLPVERDDMVAGVKVTPLVISQALVKRAEAASALKPPVKVQSFLPLRVAVLILEKADQAERKRFRAALDLKLGWFGASLVDVDEVEDSTEAFAAAFSRLLERGAQVIMAAGASSLDPLEPLFLSLAQLGARIEKHGVPVHPGSLFWIAYLPTGEQSVPVFGLSSCEMFSHRTILDLALPRVFAGEHLGRDELARLGHGGLLTREMSFRFPPYTGAP